jgi:hypothetical protein
LIDPSALRAAKALLIKIYSTLIAFTAIKADGSIKMWGGSGHGDTSAPRIAQ